MDYDAIIRDTERGRGKRVIVLILALMLVALVIGVVVRGFKGYSPSSGASALTSGSAVCLLAGSKIRRLEGPHAS